MAFEILREHGVAFDALLTDARDTDEQNDFVETGEDEAAVLVWLNNIYNITVSDDRTL